MALYAHSAVLGDVRGRDWLATMALQGLLANPGDSFTRTTITGRDYAEKTARMAYKYADAMLKVSDEEPINEDDLPEQKPKS